MNHTGMQKKNIVLIGLSGAGKSTVGMALSYKLRMPFVDMDNYIERKENKRISEIYEQFGNDYFRDLETMTAKHIGLTYFNTVVSTGGGVILRPENMEYLKKHGIVVYINRSVESIMKTLNVQKRPVLGGRPEKLYELYEQRHGLYLKYADVVVSNGADFKSAVENVYDAVADLVKNQ